MSEDNENFQQDFQPDPAPRRRWWVPGPGARDRAVGLRGAVAVGLAGLVLGGSGGYALHVAAADHHPGDGVGQLGRPVSDGEPHGHPFPPGGAPGQLPPAIGEDDGAQQD